MGHVPKQIGLSLGCCVPQTEGSGTSIVPLNTCRAGTIELTVPGTVCTGWRWWKKSDLLCGTLLYIVGQKFSEQYVAQPTGVSLTYLGVRANKSYQPLYVRKWLCAKCINETIYTDQHTKQLSPNHPALKGPGFPNVHHPNWVTGHQISNTSERLHSEWLSFQPGLQPFVWICRAL